MNTIAAKVIVLTGLFTVTFLLSILPVKIISAVQHTLDPQKRQRYKIGLGLMNCFGGGVFLGACLLDLFPEVRDELSESMRELKIKAGFPVAEFVMVFGFFMVFIVEQIVLYCQETSLVTHVARSSERGPLLDDANERHVQYNALPFSSDERNGQRAVPIVSRSYESSFDSHSFYGDDVQKHSTMRAVLLMLALSLHSVFEGFAIGLQPGIPELVKLLAAVAIHKCVIAFSLGLNLVQSRLKLKTTILLNVIFSIMTPLGIGFGITIMGFSHSLITHLISGVLQGIACGTFLFVTFFEVLPHEMNSFGARLPKVIATIVGFAAVCGALLLETSDDM